MEKRINVLVVEDSPLAAEAILRSLRSSGYELAATEVVDAPQGLASALAARSWDVVISDYVMPSFNGAQALEIFKAYHLEIPFICVSGEIGDEKAAELIRAGANNFVSKSRLARLGEVVSMERIAASERRERRAVADQTAHLAAIVEGTDDAIFSRDITGTILSWNGAAERMYGYSAPEAIGKPVSFLVPPERMGEVLDVRNKLQKGERIERMETVRVRKDGTSLDVSITVSPIKDANGRTIGASVIARDITERVKMERERLKLIAELRDALSKVKQLSGLLPICSGCKRIRDEDGRWQQVEVYVQQHSQADFTHGICPECTKHLYPDLFDRMENKGG